MRNKEWDVLKGILIFFVVLGHAPLLGVETLHRYIYWFHMPSFFILNGFLTNWSNNSIHKFFRNRFCSYIVPYISFSLLFILFSDEKLKCLVKLALGGNLNITWFSYPYWFILVLFISASFYKVMNEKMSSNRRWLVCISMWIFAHVFSILNITVSLPFGIEYCLIAIPFLMLGDCLKKVIQQFNFKYIMIALTVLSFVLVLDITGNIYYELNIQEHIYKNMILDILIPVCSYYLLSQFSIVLCKLTKVSDMIQEIGKSSNIIFFTHAALLTTIKKAIYNIDNIHISNFIVIIFIFGILLIGTLLCYFGNKNKVFRRYFSGKF